MQLFLLIFHLYFESAAWEFPQNHVGLKPKETVP
jgi:hypothetical protein